MATRNASARWQGTLKEGQGTMKLGSGAFEGSYSFGSRFEEEPGTNPEELIGAAHAGCFSMALALLLQEAGYRAERIETSAKVTLGKQGDGFAITGIALTCEAAVDGIGADRFQEQAQAAKEDCPVSKALGAVPIELEAKLTS